jgi:hypothetical protein
MIGKGVYFAPFFVPIYKDCAFFILKKVLKMYMGCLYRS